MWVSKLGSDHYEELAKTFIGNLKVSDGGFATTVRHSPSGMTRRGVYWLVRASNGLWQVKIHSTPLPLFFTLNLYKTFPLSLQPRTHPAISH